MKTIDRCQREFDYEFFILNAWMTAPT